MTQRSQMPEGRCQKWEVGMLGTVHGLRFTVCVSRSQR